MSDTHSGVPRDLPDYVPNWPAVKVKAKVYRDRTFFGGPCWRWRHACPCRGGAILYGFPETTHQQALAGALSHVRSCW